MRSFARTCCGLLLVITACFGTPAWGQKTTSSPVVEALQPFVERQTLAGAVTLIADREKVLGVDTVGYADKAANKPMQRDSVFWIASMSKPITGAALMILVDEGRVKLDDPVEKYLPEFRDVWLTAEVDSEHLLLKRPATKMTVEHVLSHTSGLPFKSVLEQPTLDATSIRDNARSYAMTPLLSEPGAKYLYSNAGINTAGRIIEVVSGKSFEQFLDDRLFGPLGMVDTTFWPQEKQLARLATPYKPTAEKNALEATTISQLRYPLNDRTRQPMPGGGLFSTADDVARFCRMVLNEGTLDGKKILSPEAVRVMTARHTGEHLKESYGLGWSVGGDTCSHGGALSTNMTIHRKDGLIFVYMVQHAGYANTDGGQIQPAFQQAARKAYVK